MIVRGLVRYSGPQQAGFFGDVPAVMLAFGRKAVKAVRGPGIGATGFQDFVGVTGGSIPPD